MGGGEGQDPAVMAVKPFNLGSLGVVWDRALWMNSGNSKHNTGSLFLKNVNFRTQVLGMSRNLTHKT